MKIKSNNRIIQYLTCLPLIILLCTVFIVDRELPNPTIVGKYAFFYSVIGGVVLGGFLLSFLKKGEVIINKTDILATLFFISLLGISFINAKSPENKWVLFTFLLILYYSIKVYVSLLPQVVPLITTTLLATGCIEGIWGLLQLYGFTASYHTSFNLTGSFFNPGPYGGYLAMIFPLALYYALYYKVVSSEKISSSNLVVHLRWFLAVFTCIVILLVLPATMNRAAWLATTVSGVFIGWSWYKEKEDFRLSALFYIWRSKCIVTVSIILLLISGWYIYSIKKDSAYGRLLIWKIGVHAIVANPWGTGLGIYSSQYGKSQHQYFQTGEGTEHQHRVAGNPEYGFNEYLQIGIEGGIMSLLLYLLLLGVIIKTGMQYKAYGPLGGIISLLVFSFMSYPFSVLPFLIVFVFLIVLTTRESKRYTLQETPIIVFTLSLIIISGILLPDRFRMITAYKKWKADQILYTAGFYPKVNEKYEEILPWLNHEIQFLFEYAQSLSKAELYERSNQILYKAMQISCDPMLYNIMGKNYQAMGEYENAESCFIYSATLVPSRFYPWYLLGKLYNETGQAEKVCEVARILEEKYAKIHSPAIEEMREELKKLCEIAIYKSKSQRKEAVYIENEK